MAYKILVFDENNKQLKFLENSKVQEPLFEMSIPYERFGYCSAYGIDYLVDDIGRNIINFMYKAEMGIEEDMKIHKSYDIVTDEEYDNLYHDRGFDYVEQEIYLYDM